MRSNLLAVAGSQILYHLTETCVIHIHLCYIYHSRKIILIAQFPCLLCADLYAGLAGYHDNRCICCADCFFHFTDKIEISRCIENVDLRFLPLDRDQACAD